MVAQKKFMPGQLIIQFVRGINPTDCVRAINQSGHTVIHHNEIGGTYFVAVPIGEEGNCAVRYRALWNVKSAELNRRY